MSKKLIQAAAGAGGESVYVEDVFSTYLYEGNGSTQTITNGIDLSGEGGLVWIKDRSSASNQHSLNDTERGATKLLKSNSTDAEGTSDLTAFNSNGFDVRYQQTGYINESGGDLVSWTFRKQAGFFDVVTYTGNGTAGRTVSHNLGSTPAVMIIKNRTTNGRNWVIYHESLGNTKALDFTTGAAFTWTAWNSTSPTDSEFTVSADAEVNANGESFVAYLFAHDDQSFGDDGDESIIKCGSYTGNGNADGPEINLGFEPQWILLKNSDAAENWFIFDVMRGWTTKGSTSVYLRPHLANAESSPVDFGINITSTGFKINTTSGSFNTSGDNHIYIAIRRPMKTPEAGTDVYNPIATTTTTPTTSYTVGFPADFLLQGYRTYGISPRTTTRLIGSSNYLETASTASEATGFGSEWDLQDDYAQAAGVSTGVISWFFKRATGFFDVVAYTGDGTSSRSLNHNLGVAPELMIIKQRSATRSWAVYSSATGTGKFLKLEDSAGVVTQSGIFDTAPTSSVFTVDSNTYVNISGGTYIAYLFATLAGVSKVGSYTGTAASLDIDCGFTSGARFILIKRTDSTSDWYVWDSARGIVSGDDPYSLLNTTGTEQTNQNYVNPYSAGFTMTSNGFASVNVSGGTYIFLAIA